MQASIRVIVMVSMAAGAAAPMVLRTAISAASPPETRKSENGVMKENQEIRLSKLGHVMLGVTDLSRSLEFYRGKLGLRVLHQSENLAFVDAQSVTIGLSLDLGTLQKSLPGAVELVFPVADVALEFRRLSGLGLEFLKAPRRATPSDWVATFRDPDGHLLSVFGPSEAPEAGQQP